MIQQDMPLSAAAVVARFNEAFNRHDADALAEWLTDDTIFEDTSPAPDGRRIQGKAAVVAFWRDWFARNSDSVFEGEDTIVAGDRVVVRPSAKEEMTSSGLIIPDTAKEKPQEGTVIAVGAGKLSDKGDRQPLEVKEGDRVLFAKYGGTEFKLDGEDLLVLRESDILAILEDKK